MSAIGAMALTVVAVGCSSPGVEVVTTAPAAQTDDSGGNAEATQAAAGAGQGSWQGTITFRAVEDSVKDDTETSGAGVYQQTTTSHDTTQSDVTDEFTVANQDPTEQDLGEIQLLGAVASHGTTDARSVSDADQYNSLNCHYTVEVGSELQGSWTEDSYGSGSITFQKDGSYVITMGETGKPGTGESPQSPLLPDHRWHTDTIISGAAGDCPQSEPDQTTSDPTNLEWASSVLGPYDQIQGKLDPGSPGSIVDGSATFKETQPPDTTLTVTWHLVHTGPIPLPTY